MPVLIQLTKCLHFSSAAKVSMSELFTFDLYTVFDMYSIYRSKDIKRLMIRFMYLLDILLSKNSG